VSLQLTTIQHLDTAESVFKLTLMPTNGAQKKAPAPYFFLHEHQVIKNMQKKIQRLQYLPQSPYGANLPRWGRQEGAGQTNYPKERL
jgi:hypothetical protein